MKVVICWTGISGYMSSCWRELSKLDGFDVTVFCYADQGFDKGLFEGLSGEVMSPEELTDPAVLVPKVVAEAPDVVVVAGWGWSSFLALAKASELRHAKFVMGVDNPYVGTLKQQMGKYARHGYFSRIDAVIVPGERAWQLVSRLGFEERQIYRGMYGIDFSRFGPMYERRLELDEWPKRFLYIGRYTEVKAIDILTSGYSMYRDLVGDPWELTMCGSGELKELVEAMPVINDRGFVQPGDLSDVFVEHGVFVLPSRYDPWPLVIVESCAAGLPVICTERCGSAVENVRPMYNGIMTPADDPRAIASAMRWMHDHHDMLPDMGRRSRELASAYSAEFWAMRWERMLREVCPMGNR